MVVRAINSINFNSNVKRQNISFGKNSVEENDKTEQRNTSNKFVTVPVSLLIALATAAPLNAGTNQAQATENTNEIELVENTQQTKPQGIPYNYKGIASQDIRKVIQTKVGNKNYNIIFTDHKVAKEKDGVRFVYIAPEDYKDAIYKEPPRVLNLIYHNLGDDSKSFCGVSVYEELYDKEGLEIEKVKREIVIPDESAQEILDLISNYTKFKNKTGIRFLETTRPTPYPNTHIK